MLRTTLAVAVLAAGAFFAQSDVSQARSFHDPALAGAGSLVETVQCVTRRQRVVRPNGSVVFRTVRNCRPAMSRNCRTVREQIRRPNGAVVFQTRRVCR